MRRQAREGSLLAHGRHIEGAPNLADRRDDLLGPDAVAGMPADPVELVVTSPGWRPDQPLLAAAGAAGVPVWGEVELAWRMRALDGAAPWLTVTGTNGKTTTVQMLASILRAAGKRAISAGNVGTPILEAIMDIWPAQTLGVADRGIREGILRSLMAKDGHRL